MIITMANVISYLLVIVGSLGVLLVSMCVCGQMKPQSSEIIRWVWTGFFGAAIISIILAFVSLFFGYFNPPSLAHGLAMMAMTILLFYNRRRDDESGNISLPNLQGNKESI